MSPFMDMSAAEIASAVRRGALSAVAVTEAALNTVEQHDCLLNCFTARLADRALTDARALDAKRDLGETSGPLAGVPFAAKNLFNIAGVTTLAGAKLRENAPPPTNDAFAVAQWRKAGAILIGATNMDEFAYGFATENAHYGPTRNPHDVTRIAGGSSGGSAAAVAGGLCPISLGSDTNGSVRVPAGLCGVFGMKPTFGRLSRTGVYPFVHSLDHVGLFARSVGDLAASYDALQGDDADDLSQARRAAELSAAQLDQDEKLRVGVLDGFFREGASEDALAALDRVADTLDATPFTLPFAREARAAAFCLTASEGGALHLDQLRASASDYDPAVRDRLIAGALAPASIALRAQRFRRFFRDEMRSVFAKFDVLLAPCTPFAAPPIGQKMINLGGKNVLVRAVAGMYTQVFSFIGLPVIAAPVQGALPVGVQLIGPPWREAALLRLARRLEREGVASARKPSDLAL